VLEEVFFSTSELICPVTSLLALEIGTPDIEMPAQEVKLKSERKINLLLLKTREK